ncbi:MAG: carbamoyltransferase HypF [bacterium]|nr:carbamoyltransferase HypF [bacterium]
MSSATTQRLRLEISGAVQGVGFRPFVYRLAREARIAGWVLNDSRGVILEVEGGHAVLERFAERVRSEHPEHAVLDRFDSAWLEPVGLSGFEIRSSEGAGDKTVSVLPDIATCGQCLREVLGRDNRRYGYPFTNCTDCGPRFSIIESLPYDRPNTTMRGFIMCERCQREYEDPADRRFHAQPNACAECGPRLTLANSVGRELARGEAALKAAAAAVRRGRIVAVKGLGGFHLMVDATDGEAVALLRRRKGRYEKPLALMVRHLDEVRALVKVATAAADLLTSSRAPIVLLPRLAESEIADGVAPGNPNLGVMLAYTPLHHLLLAEIDKPVVATSGNLSDEPIAIDNEEALARLARIADLFLLHDRPIERHVDDSVFHMVEEQAQPLRRARGWAPLPVSVPAELPCILGVGAHLKNTVALAVGDKVFISQHIGDMETPQAVAAFERVIEDFLDLYEVLPVAIARDLHPDYHSSRWPAATILKPLAALPTIAVQHHHAHLAACLADNDEPGKALGVIWDGTGYGTDGSVWGGEFLSGDAAAFERVASLRPFRLPGGDAAVREPRRVALALLWETFGEAGFERHDLASVRSFENGERAPLARMLASGFGSPVTTSAGRLFDGVAALLDLRQRVAFEGQAAMALEFIADREERGAYPLPLESREAGSETSHHDGLSVALELDWRPLVEAVLGDFRRGIAVGIIAARFHRALVEAIVDVASELGEERVALAGGCFQNRLLSEWSAERLRRAGFEVLMHRRLPPNDGSISFGQVVVAAARLERGV